MREGDELDRYLLVRSVNKGEYTTVWEATHKVLGSRHALKVLDADVPDDLADALVREGRLQSSVHHRHVMAVSDALHWHGRVVLVMHFVKAETLADFLERTPIIQLRGALSLFRNIVRGVRAMHVQNIVHRDLKPENVLLTKEEGRILPKVTDFGMAKLLEPGKPPVASGLSTSFRFMGTPEYMAPEQAGDPGRVDARADLFSLGVLLYELTTGRLPFDADTASDVMYKAARGDYEDVKSLAPAAPPTLVRVIGQLLQPKPDNRLATCDALLERLDGVRG